MNKNCERCKYCRKWEGYNKGCYCSNEDGEKYLTDIDEKNDACDKWEEKKS